MCPEEAVREAREDYDRLKERAEEEELLVTLDELEEIHTDASEKIAADELALTEDRDQFDSDVERIGEFSIVMVTH